MSNDTITPAPPAPAPAAPMLPATVPQADCSLTFATRQGLEALQRAGRLFSQSPLVPDAYQGDKGLSSCAIALDLANRIGANPLMVMQNLYIVHGRPGWSAKFKIATFNQCGRFSPIRYEFSGTEGQDDWGCRAWAIEKATGQRLDGPKVTIKLAKDEGWYSKNGSKWKTMPDLMLRYRSAGELVDTVAPELSMGLPMAEDVEDASDDLPPARVSVAPATVGVSEVKAELLPPPPAPTPASGTGRLARLRKPQEGAAAAAEPQAPVAQPADDTQAYDQALGAYKSILEAKGRPEAFVTSALRSWQSNVAPDRLAALQRAIAEAQAAPSAPGMTAVRRNPDDRAPNPMGNDDEQLPWPDAD